MRVHGQVKVNKGCYQRAQQRCTIPLCCNQRCAIPLCCNQRCTIPLCCNQRGTRIRRVCQAITKRASVGGGGGCGGQKGQARGGLACRYRVPVRLGSSSPRFQTYAVPLRRRLWRMLVYSRAVAGTQSKCSERHTEQNAGGDVPVSRVYLCVRACARACLCVCVCFSVVERRVHVTVVHDADLSCLQV